MEVDFIFNDRGHRLDLFYSLGTGCSGYVTAVTENGLCGSSTRMGQVLGAVRWAAQSKVGAWAGGVAAGNVKAGLKEDCKENLAAAYYTGGLSEEWAKAVASCQADIAAAVAENEKAGAMVLALHSYRGTLASLYGYAGHRIEQEDKADHMQALMATLIEMDAWADATDLFTVTGNEGDQTVRASARAFVLDQAAGGLGNAAGNFIPGISGHAAKAAFKAGYLSTIAGIHSGFGGQ